MCLIRTIYSVEELQQAAKDGGGIVHAEVVLRSKSLTTLPAEVREIRGSLDCIDCPQLTSLNNLQRVESLFRYTCPLSEDEPSLLKIVEGRIFLKGDEEGNPHCEDAHAVVSRRSGREYFWHGIEVPDFVILHPELISVERIYSERNTEIRRVMIYRYGLERWFQDTGATLIDDDPHFGKLYKIKNTDALMLELVRPSREPDGTFQRYFIPILPFAGNPKLPINKSRHAARSVRLLLFNLGIHIPSSET